jgi:hypothetical protein
MNRTTLEIIFAPIYVFSFVLIWYENKFTVLGAERRPQIFVGSRQGYFLVVRVVLTYGSFVGLLYVYGPVQTVLAYALYWAFSDVTFKLYFNREVNRLARFLMTANDDPPTTEAEALQNARESVIDNMNTGGLGHFHYSRL